MSKFEIVGNAKDLEAELGAGVAAAAPPAAPPAAHEAQKSAALLAARQQAAAQQAAALQTLMLLLKTLGQRAIIALADLRTVLSAAAAFYLYVVMPEDPTTHRLIALAMFLAFIIILNVIWRRGGAGQ